MQLPDTIVTLLWSNTGCGYRCIQLGQNRSASIKLEPKSQACLRSLNLAVVFIDAILVLSHFVKTQNLSSVNVTINIKILLLPCPSKDQSMLPWKTLLQHETYFPGKPSQEIVEFLESRVSSTGNERSSQNTTDSQKSSKKGQKSSKKS